MINFPFHPLTVLSKLGTYLMSIFPFRNYPRALGDFKKSPKALGGFLEVDLVRGRVGVLPFY